MATLVRPQLSYLLTQASVMSQVLLLLMNRFASVAGSVLEDLNNDGTGDEPLTGVTVQLVNENGTVVATTTTDSNGTFVFPNFPPGKYTVHEHTPSGYTDETPSIPLSGHKYGKCYQRCICRGAPLFRPQY